MKAYFVITGFAAVLFLLIVVAAVVCVSAMVASASRQDRAQMEEQATIEDLIEEVRELRLQIRRTDHGVTYAAEKKPQTETEVKKVEETKHTQADDRGNYVSCFGFGDRDDENI